MLIAKVQRYIREGDLLLRPLRITDGPFLSQMLMRDDVLRSCGIQKRPQISWFSLYRRLKALFSLCYCIEYSSERVGLAGFCRLRPDKSAEMSLIIFRDSHRRMGLGTKAFGMFSAALGDLPFIEKLLVSVRMENVAARAFWTKLGFEEIQRNENTLEFALSLTASPCTAADASPGDSGIDRDYLLQSGA
jgi:RimJ/RimL family protein N-acetyltransferase